MSLKLEENLFQEKFFKAECGQRSMRDVTFTGKGQLKKGRNFYLIRYVGNKDEKKESMNEEIYPGLL